MARHVRHDPDGLSRRARPAATAGTAPSSGLRPKPRPAGKPLLSTAYCSAGDSDVPRARKHIADLYRNMHWSPMRRPSIARTS